MTLRTRWMLYVLIGLPLAVALFWLVYVVVDPNATSQKWIFLVSLAVIGIAVGLTLWFVPRDQVAAFASEIKSKGIFDWETEPRKFELENEARKTLAQIFAGFFLLLGLYSSAETLALSREGQITDRFATAVEELGAVDASGKAKVEVRLGGIYSLEQIALDSKRYHWSVIEVLSDYFRVNDHRRANSEFPDTDEQAAINVISRRNRLFESNGQRLNLIADFDGCGLEDAHLERADLSHSQFNGAYLIRTHLECADLRFSDLSRAHDLTQEQVNSACGDATTKLPAGLQRHFRSISDCERTCWR